MRLQSTQWLLATQTPRYCPCPDITIWPAHLHLPACLLCEARLFSVVELPSQGPTVGGPAFDVILAACQRVPGGDGGLACRRWCCEHSHACASSSHRLERCRPCLRTWKRLIPGAGRAPCRAPRSPLSTTGGCSSGPCRRRASTASQRAAPKQLTGSTGAPSQLLRQLSAHYLPMCLLDRGVGCNRRCCMLVLLGTLLDG